MGYFSNGSEGMEYEARWCARCVHYDPDGNCPVLEAHADFNYRDCNDPESILHVLIPRSRNPKFTNNEQCRMFWEKAADADLFEVAAQ